MYLYCPRRNYEMGFTSVNISVRLCFMKSENTMLPSLVTRR